MQQHAAERSRAPEGKANSPPGLVGVLGVVGPLEVVGPLGPAVVEAGPLGVVGPLGLLDGVVGPLGPLGVGVKKLFRPAGWQLCLMFLKSSVLFCARGQT